MSATFPIIGQVEVSDHVAGGEYKTHPEIYAIEVTAACDLQCPMCLRTTHMTNKAPKLLDIQLLELMYDRGDFQGSSFIELQQAGEPTIHPKLHDIIKFLQDTVGVMVGLSTHGQNMTKPTCIPGGRVTDVAHVLLDLDSLTISVDSVDPEVYAKMRVPKTFDQLEEQLAHFFKRCEIREVTLPFIELQLVKTKLVPGSGDVEALTRFVKEKGWDKYCSIRTVNDSFVEMQDRGVMLRSENNFCINPWTSVNVTQDGDVVSCCYIFDHKPGDITWYGNLWKNSLEEIWHSNRVRIMRESHLQDNRRDACAKCYQPSPTLIHQNIVSRLVRARRK